MKVLSVSEMITNSAVLLSPRVSSSSSSVSIRSRSSFMSNGANLAPQEISMDFKVLPAAILNLRYCFTAKWSGSFSSSCWNRISTGLW